MGVGSFLLLFIVAPILVDLILVIVAWWIPGNRVLLLGLLLLYIALNVVAPIFILFYYYLDKIGFEQAVYGTAFIIFLRLLEIFGASLGRTFLDMWKQSKLIT